MSSGSGKIRVVKRDALLEAFSRAKLAGAMHRAMLATEGTYPDAWELAWAIEIYLRRRHWTCISSAALRDMAGKVLRRVRLAGAAEAMAAHHADRARKRAATWIDHGEGRRSAWDKTWIAQLAKQVWQVSPATARILAGDVEAAVLRREGVIVPRREVIDVLGRHVGAYGLAGAVSLPRGAPANSPSPAERAAHS